jgi:transketolase
MSIIELDTVALARRIRADVLRMVHAAKASHVGSALSCVDILAVLYGGVLRVAPAKLDDPDRDRFILSKGHAAAAIYATLANTGFFARERLATYCANGTALAGHAHHHGVPGVEISTGSLGHGLPIGVGMALAAQADGRPTKVYVVLSDGECDEGSNWEAALFAPQHKLRNLTAIVDYNKIQSYGRVADVLELHPLVDKWRAFRWNVREVDGHDHAQLRQALTAPPGVDENPDHPRMLIAHTVKGKGVSFMEDQNVWHYRNPSDEQLAKALAELEAPGAARGRGDKSK